jgi:hypothetical protein
VIPYIYQLKEYVCGFHVIDNLQVLTKEENLSKHNLYWPDMSEITPELKQLAKDFYANQTS